MGMPRLPALVWLKTYDRTALGDDLMASVIVTIMLIPQSLAYAMLAGLPPEAGLYASMLPLVAYAAFGSSRALAVGPVAVISLMTATTLAEVVAAGHGSYGDAAMVLALLSGLFLVLLGVLRMGFLANFLSHAVIVGFVTASGLLIAVGQLRYLLAVDGEGHNVFAMAASLITKVPATHLPTLLIGVGAILFLLFVRSRLGPLLLRLGMRPRLVAYATRAGPVLAVIASIVLVGALGLAARGVPVVGDVPAGLPSLHLPVPDLALVLALLPSAVLISVVGFVESISVAQSLAMRRRQRVVPDQELVGLGAANLAAGLSGGFPVTGGFTRSVVNFDAGAVTPMAGVFTAVLMGLTAAFLTPVFHDLPKAVLAATIIVAVLSLVDLGAIRRTWRQAPGDFAALAATMIGVLTVGIEAGIVLGITVSLSIHLWRSSRPHIAVVGRVPGTEHFRNVDRHAVQVCATLLSVRVDESLYFANARFLEDRLLELVTARPEVKDVVLLCSAVNGIDGSAVETLESINERLRVAGVRFHLSEVKGPVMDTLKRTDLLTHLSGEVFFTQHDAMQALAGEAPVEPDRDRPATRAALAGAPGRD
ncbi:MAG: sulfate permease [Pseudomonadales bacterium]|jgi:SulP family sulfate permease|nr:sulfate permease [Pseudomonadales bacterium]